ncbi:type IV secretion system protein (plasmid) [Agrobacterium tumefaciens]|nr:type IV secretion system protein [Agrobacterium tumefaciens]
MLSKIDALGITTVQSIYDRLANHLGPLFIAALTIYVIWWGYEMLFGRAPMTAGEFVWRFGRAFICYTFIISWAAYSPLIAKPLLDGPVGVASIFCEAAGGENCGTDNASMGSGLKDIWTAAITGAKTIAAKGGVTAPQFFFAALFVLAFAIVVCAMGAVILIVGKMTMFILLAIGPIVLCAALFRLTSSVVDGWIRTLAAYAILPVLVYTTLGLMTTILRSTINDMQKGDAVFSTLGAFCFMCAATTYLLKELVSLAAGIAGGAARVDATGRNVWASGKYLATNGPGALLDVSRFIGGKVGSTLNRQHGSIGDGDAAAAQVRAASVNSRK